MSAERPHDLDPDEREFVVEFARPLDLLGAGMAGCPPFDRVLASQEGVLAEPDQQAVSAHVRDCAACRALLRDALASDVEITAADLARGRAQLPSGPSAARTLNRTSMLAVAAALAAVVISSLWAFSLRQENRALRDAAGVTRSDTSRQLEDARSRNETLEREVARLQQPAVALNVPLIDLEPIGALRSGATSAASVSRTAPLVIFVLAITGAAAPEGYTLEIRDSADRVTWTGSGLRATAAGTVTLAVPRALLPAGSLTLRLSATRGTAVHRYTIRIAEAP
jgi:hypothetical protein